MPNYGNIDPNTGRPTTTAPVTAPGQTPTQPWQNQVVSGSLPNAQGMAGTGYTAPTPAAPQPSQPAQQPQMPAGDFDLSQPGFGEQFFASTQGQWTAPTAGERAYNQFAPQLAGPSNAEIGLYGNAQRAMQPGAVQNFWGQQGGNMLGHTGDANALSGVFGEWQGTSANMDPYYDNAVRQSLESVNQNAAARGAYGSSAAIDSGTEAVTNLRAQQARDEAQYGLDRLQLGGDLAGSLEQNQLDWFGQAGDIATSAEEAAVARELAGVQANTAMGNLGNERLGMLFDAAGTAGDQEIDRLSAGQRAASGAQADRGDRIGQVFDATMGVGSEVSDAAGESISMQNADQAALLKAAIEASLGRALTAVEWDKFQREQADKEFANIAEGVSSFWNPMGGGGGGGG